VPINIIIATTALTLILEHDPGAAASTQVESDSFAKSRLSLPPFSEAREVAFDVKRQSIMAGLL
jgi:hypothetical protein